MQKSIKSKKNARTIIPETLSFSLLYLGSCSKFFSIQSIVISKLTSDNCLPILTLPPYSDINQLNADVICTDVGSNRAEIDFAEIYDPAVPDVPVPANTFIISFATNAPYKALNAGVNYLRRPSCQIDQDFCSTTDYVKSCTENQVQFANGFVISQDTVYIVPGPSTYVGCSFAEDSCCAYIVPGFCPRTADDSVFKVKINHKPEEHHERPHHERPPHEKPHERPHHERPHDDGDDDEDDQDRHNHKKQVNTPPQKDVKKDVKKEAKKEELKELIPLNPVPVKKDAKKVMPLIPLRVVTGRRPNPNPKFADDDDGEDDKKKK